MAGERVGSLGVSAHKRKAYVVVCDEFEQAHWTRDAAQEHIDAIVDHGACPSEHRIVERFIVPGALGTEAQTG